MIKTSMAEIWNKKIKKVDSMIILVQEIIDGTMEDNSELLSGLLEYKSDLMGIKNSITIAYMRVLPI